MAPRATRLREALLRAMSVDEARVLMHDLFGAKVLEGLPSSVTPAQFFFELTSLLERRGLVTRALFAAVAQLAPGRYDELAAVAHEWGSELPRDQEMAPRESSLTLSTLLAELPDVLAREGRDPAAHLASAGIAVTTWGGAPDGWAHACDRLDELGLHGILPTLQLIEDVQRSRFSDQVSRWALRYVALVLELTGHSGAGGLRRAVQEFAYDEAQRWLRLAEAARTMRADGALSEAELVQIEERSRTWGLAAFTARTMMARSQGDSQGSWISRALAETNGGEIFRLGLAPRGTAKRPS